MLQAHLICLASLGRALAECFRWCNISEDGLAKEKVSLIQKYFKLKSQLMKQAERHSLLFFTHPGCKEKYSALDSARFRQKEIGLSHSPGSFS